jgi:hypothetical protein
VVKNSPFFALIFLNGRAFCLDTRDNFGGILNRKMVVIFMRIELIEKQIDRLTLSEIAKERFGDLVKAVVDIEKRVMSVGAELHADEEAILLDQGSQQQDLWGINLYPHKTGEEFIEFDSMINLRPSQGNLSRGVNDPSIREKIKEIVRELVKES